MLLTLRSASSSASETASDCFGKGLSVPQRLLRKAYHAISPRPQVWSFSLPARLFRQPVPFALPPALPQRLRLQSCLGDRFGTASQTQRLSASETASEGLSRHLTSSSETASESASETDSVFVFMTGRNCFLAPSNAPNPP